VPERRSHDRVPRCEVCGEPVWDARPHEGKDGVIHRECLPEVANPEEVAELEREAEGEA
jgi:hypothetical protein